MRTMGKLVALWLVCAVGVAASGPARAALLTAEDAVKIALQKSSSVVNARAGVLSGRSGSLSAWGGVLPSISADITHSESQTENSTSGTFIGGQFVANPLSDSRQKFDAPTLSAQWSVVNLGNLRELSAARHGLRASRQSLQAARNDVALATRRQFYEVVKAVRLAQVSAGSLQLSRDDERRVKAMFEVGSVSKSDLLKAQVATAQSELNQITAVNQVAVQRSLLASLIGVAESELGEVDTLLTAEPQTYDELSLLAEASRNRPDMMAAEAELASARASHSAARLARLPSLNASGSVSFNGKGNRRVIGPGSTSGTSEFASSSDRDLSGSLSLSMNIFNLAALDARAASARAALDRAQDARDALRRNLTSEVHQQVLAYNQAIQLADVAKRGLDSATENLKLTQEKYKVGSATILELIDAQVQLQTAQSNVVTALAAIRVAEAQINRVRGQGE